MKKVAGLRWLGIVLLFLGALGTSLGLAIVLEMATREYGTSSDFWRDVLLEDPERWVWQIGLLIVIFGIWMVNRSLIGMLVLGSVGTTLGMITALFIYPFMASTLTEYLSIVWMKAPDRWLWFIGILIMVAAIGLVNRSFKKGSCTDPE
ncbi:hypothetical protein [Staphylospora marina]|uniref:hypothetical protein n=1 Tax=Staphylospora marina TaxID=2490858 RepID=UPI000F5BF0AF|nr:hypothetical protein [Staphylospora marina]